MSAWPAAKPWSRGSAQPSPNSAPTTSTAGCSAFGPRFGWRQTGTLDKLQAEANLGAVALVIARRKQDGRSGHVTLVVPEKDAFKARRNAAGVVIAPLQSQAGARNFRFDPGVTNWWNGEQFAESGFWIHP